MKKTILFLLTIFIVFSCIVTSFAESVDYSFLDNMSIDELNALKNEIDKRISAKSKADILSSDFGMWEIKNYVDEFRNPTDEQYIRNKSLINGSFNNSAANNRELKVLFLIDNYVSIMLYEYGSSLVKNPYSESRKYDVTMQNGDGRKLSLTGTMSSSGDRIRFSRSDSDRIMYALRHDYKVAFYIVDQERKTTNYLFTIDDSSYFSNVYNAFFGEKAQSLDAKQDIYPAIIDQEKVEHYAKNLPDEIFSWDYYEIKEHAGELYFLSGTVVKVINDDKFYIDVGKEMKVYVDFTDAYAKGIQSSIIVPNEGDHISLYCTLETSMYDFFIKENVIKFMLGFET